MTMPTHIRRKEGPKDFIPAYSTDELLRGVCHIVSLPRLDKKIPALDRVKQTRIILDEGRRIGTAARSAKSRRKFEENREAILQLIAEGRGIKHIAVKFRMGFKQLESYLAKYYGRKKGNRTQIELSKARFELHKSEIYAMLAEKRGVWTIAETFGIGGRQLKRHLEEDKTK